ncbi:hypothetical protein WICANDRAFT_64937 [Wickerhamomyces anomalus NRRL Y-366-8]|uniref:ATP synthase subunit 4 n=1 Tax=Wickerhamomyces anomalus (strain ATCC 58044 / CBS 1984 / NCYC 433 / NRRL Y-366-8) TaxID=683960 RepID=A0A1E3NWK7_WICAA|nr:uncharacterized protein WICANDRAFT_64937 [Wickerhamomyces anomalus NRRL Y-366-8]ODQ57589.1 hypothetical protein WICANDRAFT_64937 [Wickerhamomyces anomalus NRRL Y-366-8]
MSLRQLSLRAIRPASFALRSAPIGVRCLSTQTPEPKAKATSIIDALPGNSVLSKTGILATGTAASIYAISNELYVVNEESILLGCFLAFSGLVVKYVAPLYNDWAESRIKSVSEILNSSRVKHVEAVKDRIESVSELKDVVNTTKVLFEVSKETVELEAQAFELKQKVELASEAKSVLDSWVRYEASVRQLQQQQLAQTVIANVEKELTNPKFQDKVLQEAVADIEKVFASAK